MDQDSLMYKMSEVVFRMHSLGPVRETDRFSEGERAILYNLYHSPGGLYSGTLAERLHVGTGRIGNALKTLEKKKFITRQTDKKDKRRVLVKLTEAGKEHMADIESHVLANQKNILAVYGEERMEHFLVELEALLDAIETVDKKEAENV